MQANDAILADSCLQCLVDVVVLLASLLVGAEFVSNTIISVCLFSAAGKLAWQREQQHTYGNVACFAQQ